MTKAELDRLMALSPRERLELGLLLLSSVRGDALVATEAGGAGRSLHELIEERLRETPPTAAAAAAGEPDPTDR